MDESLFKETLADLARLHGSRLEALRVERAVVGVVFSGVKLSDGSGGMAGTPRREGPAAAADRDLPPPGDLRGRPVLSLLRPWPAEPFRRSLALAALSALSSAWLKPDRYRVVYDRDALDLAELGPGVRATIVGAFHRYIDRLRLVPGVRLHVLEMRPSALRPEDMPYYVPAEAADKVVPQSDWVIITGLTLANMTLCGLLALARPGARIMVVGPSASILPDALFRRKVALVGGGLMTASDAALDLLSQGAYARHLYAGCARRINLLPL
jgi:uncharacterized protein (DUF4213/DUF364 family)